MFSQQVVKVLSNLLLALILLATAAFADSDSDSDSDSGASGLVYQDIAAGGGAGLSYERVPSASLYTDHEAHEEDPC